MIPSTNLFERKSDALFRTTYTFQTSNKKILNQCIIHLSLREDRFQNTLDRETIKNSDGLTINET
jgi:hypothetical protein